MAYVRDEEKVLSKVAEPLIEQYHPDLAEVDIQFLWRDEAVVSKGRLVISMSVKVDNRNFCLHGHDAIIEMARDLWDEASEIHRKIFMDHALSHFMVLREDNGELARTEDGRIKLYTRPYDLMEFKEIVTRYGNDYPEMELFKEAFSKSDPAKSKEAPPTKGVDPSNVVAD